MPLVFHRFLDGVQAERFAAAVREIEPELEANVYMSQIAFYDGTAVEVDGKRYDQFPFAVVMPAVTVERPCRGDDDAEEREDALEAVVIAYGGKFVGT